jgi:hypothetical protein
MSDKKCHYIMGKHAVYKATEAKSYDELHRVVKVHSHAVDAPFNKY